MSAWCFKDLWKEALLRLKYKIWSAVSLQVKRFTVALTMKGAFAWFGKHYITPIGKHYITLIIGTLNAFWMDCRDAHGFGLSFTATGYGPPLRSHVSRRSSTCLLKFYTSTMMAMMSTMPVSTRVARNLLIMPLAKFPDEWEPTFYGPNLVEKPCYWCTPRHSNSRDSTPYSLSAGI